VAGGRGQKTHFTQLSQETQIFLQENVLQLHWCANKVSNSTCLKKNYIFFARHFWDFPKIFQISTQFFAKDKKTPPL
jgi:hypothetical protein